MKKFLVVVIVLFLSLSLSGCLTLTGAGLGAGTGALVGVAGGKKNIGRAAAWGALIGGTLGFLGETYGGGYRSGEYYDRRPEGYGQNYNQPSYQSRQLMNCYGFRTEDVWGIDKYGNRYVQYTQQVQIQILCP
ncbi:MAG: hypothetical protein AAB491_01255 [Patescibacteria group bacterium]